MTVMIVRKKAALRMPREEGVAFNQRSSRSPSGLSARQWRDMLTSCADTIERERKARPPRPLRAGELVGITERSNHGSGALPSRGEVFKSVGWYKGVSKYGEKPPLHEIQLWPKGELYLARYAHIVPFGGLRFFALGGEVWEVTDNDFRKLDYSKSLGEIASALDAVWHARNKIVPQELVEDAA